MGFTPLRQLRLIGESHLNISSSGDWDYQRMAPDFHVIMRDSPRIFWGYFSIPAGFFLKSSRDKFGCLKISFKVFSWRFFFLLFASFEIYIHALMFLFAVRFTKLLRLFFTPLLSFLLSIYKFFLLRVSFIFNRNLFWFLECLSNLIGFWVSDEAPLSFWNLKRKE